MRKTNCLSFEQVRSKSSLWLKPLRKIKSGNTHKALKKNLNLEEEVFSKDEMTEKKGRRKERPDRKWG